MTLGDSPLTPRQRSAAGSAGFAAAIGALAGAALAGGWGGRAGVAGAVGGAAVLGVVDGVARARQGRAEIPALWARIVASGAPAGPLPSEPAAAGEPA